MGIINLLNDGPLTKELCEQVGINPWATAMLADSFKKAPHRTKQRGLRFCINDYDFTIKKATSLPEQIRDLRYAMGNLSIEEIDFWQINPFATVMMVEAYMKSPLKFRDHGIMFTTHGLIIRIKPVTDQKLLLKCKEDRKKVKK